MGSWGAGRFGRRLLFEELGRHGRGACLLWGGVGGVSDGFLWGGGGEEDGGGVRCGEEWGREQLGFYKSEVRVIPSHYLSLPTTCHCPLLVTAHCLSLPTIKGLVKGLVQRTFQQIQKGNKEEGQDGVEKLCDDGVAME